MTKTILILVGCIVLSACIGDDFLDDAVDPEIRITKAIDSLEINDNFQFEFLFLNEIGESENIVPNWTSSNEEIIAITKGGFATGLAIGESIVTVTYVDEFGSELFDERSIIVSDSVTNNFEGGSKTGLIQTTSSYLLTGNLIYRETQSGVRIEIGEDYKASTTLPGLYIYLSNNKNSISDALEVAKVTTFSGAHSYDITNVGFEDYKYILYYCKPFNIKVGEAELL